MAASRSGSLRVVSAEIQRDGRYLLTQRSAHAVLPLLWEFPGGRVREGESDAEALSRTVQFRVGIDVELDEKLMEVVHDYGNNQVTLVVYRCSLPAHEPFANNVQAIAWVLPEEFADYPFPAADQKTIEQLMQEGG